LLVDGDYNVFVM